MGDVHLIAHDQNKCITPKDGETQREKFFTVLGFDYSDNIISGLLENSKINNNYSSSITDYQLPVTTEQCLFLQHSSFVNCSRLNIASRSKFGIHTYRGTIDDEELMELIVGKQEAVEGV